MVFIDRKDLPSWACVLVNMRMRLSLPTKVRFVHRVLMASLQA